VYKLLEDCVTYVNGSLNKEGAIKIIKEAIERYEEHFGK
jgi:inorganic pyrophosphatase